METTREKVWFLSTIFTKKDLGRMIGVTDNTLRNWENGSIPLKYTEPIDSIIKRVNESDVEKGQQTSLRTQLLVQRVVNGDKDNGATLVELNHELSELNKNLRDLDKTLKAVFKVKGGE